MKRGAKSNSAAARGDRHRPGVRFGDDGGEALGLCPDSTSAGIKGVVGLVAGRIKRPVESTGHRLWRAAEDGSLRGSARSRAGVNIRDALDSIRGTSSVSSTIRRPRMAAGS